MTAPIDMESLRLVIAVLDLALAELAARRIIEAVRNQA